MAATTIIQTPLPFLHYSPKQQSSQQSIASTSYSKPLSFSTSRTTYHQTPFSADSHKSLIHLQRVDESSSPKSFIDTLFYLLRLSAKHGDIKLCRTIHGCILKIDEDTHLGTALIGAYIKLGTIADAYSVFNGLSSPNDVSYASLISGFAKFNREMEAILLFFRMRDAGIVLNEYSFVAILTACMRVLDLELGSQIHALVIKTGYLDAVFVANALMGMYGKCGCFDYVLKLFDKMPQRDIASWNTVVSTVVKEGLYEKAFGLFRSMQIIDGFVVDKFMVSSILTACTGRNSSIEGREVHAHALRVGLENNLSVNNALIGFYTACGSVKDVESLFQRMPVKDIITWTSMITAYMEFGSVDIALELFQKMPGRNDISFNALMAGLCHNGEGLMAFKLFIEMVEKGLKLTDFTLTSIISACGLLMDIRISEQIHGFTLKFGYGSNACIETAMLDMCTKCGRMVDAEKMFSRWSLKEKSSVLETTMICGYARNGQPQEAISFFHRNQLEGMLVLDEVLLASVIGVCGTLGFYEMGKQVHCQAYKSGFVSAIAVANSIVSMYSKCDNIKKAVQVFDEMPLHDIVSWNCLISARLLQRQGDEALAIWSKIEKTGIEPDLITFVLVISAYQHTRSNLVNTCRDFFLAIKTVYGFEPISEHYASFVRVLGYWGHFEEAEEIINKMPFEPDVSVWRALLDSGKLQRESQMGKRAVKRLLSIEPKDPATFILQSNLYSAQGRWDSSETLRNDMREKKMTKHPCRSWIIHQNKVTSFYARDKSHSQSKDIYSVLDALILECMKSGYKPDTRYVLHEVEEYQKKDFLFYHSAKLAASYGLLITTTGPVRIMKNIRLCGDCHTFLKYVSLITKREIVVRDSSGFHCLARGHCSCKDTW